MDPPEIVQKRRRRYQRFFRRAFMVGAGLALILFGLPLFLPTPISMQSGASGARLLPYELVDSQVLLVSILLAIVLWSLVGWITTTLLLWLDAFRAPPNSRYRTR